ncbi:MAG: hypothetical protein FDW93_01565 [Bergeyella sp.]|nr:hypothetical protein [Bergeyella sp.]
MKEKIKKQKYHREVIAILAQEFQVTDRFVRFCIRGERHSDKAETIKTKYKELIKPTSLAIYNFKNKIT